MVQFFLENPTLHTAFVYCTICPLCSLGCLIGLRLLRLPPEHQNRRYLENR